MYEHSVDSLTLNLLVKLDSKSYACIRVAMSLMFCENRVLIKDNLAQFEVAQLANLCCEDAEEAKALIPR